ncbi:LBL_2463 family protein [Leptospira stimsonii]|uniref:Uncharacterized protein n=1 Tax=Leptospira stimsonii TaxID=2202203 RepID=A0ABY2MZW5_9LEPT|nr:hypothetical protein [Leptospira stimsonii]TGK18835.1 hypothetical protein EHO98_12255 [Leptospira stimsonii]TGM12909.1 hypothetical protein EHQ90_14740 [Leptospira stimsonii]
MSLTTLKKSDTYSDANFANHTCEYISCTYETNPEIIEHARSFVREQYSKLGYVGYDSDFDRQFDLNGFGRYFIALKEKNTIVATSRVLTRGPNGLPIEYAIRKDTEQKMKLEAGNIAEMNSFAATSMKEGTRVLVMGAEYVLEQNFEATYGLYDVNRPGVGKLYNRLGAVDSKGHPYKIYFPGYGKIESEKIIPTEWAIQVSDYSKIIAKIRHA